MVLVACCSVACFQVDQDSLNWPAGSSGLQSFWLSLQSFPVDGRLLVQLVQPQGAVLNPAAAATEVQVQSPMVGFVTNLVSPLLAE
jgi:hypothetical protein